ncbi:nucleoside deaminase [Nocardioides sp. SR21]|uniref:nucleoside deaminase n=1 Tax=Nocardioides sp. SR21 TaxID=2919501 RepID=UPI001FAA3179|nr:nucleoside deaminase [Nocardioides sp. SR21]
MTDKTWLDRAVERATANVAENGGPFAAMVVREGELISVGTNRVTRDLDPTAHAEVVAIREACAKLGDFSLAGSVLYTSCEPCPLCVAACLWARLDRVVYAADRHDAARGGFDDHEFYELMDRDRETWPMPVHRGDQAGSFAPFEAWLAKPDRTEY